MVRIISLGLGVQSTALYFMSCMGLLPHADYAIFADTGKESKATYDYLAFLINWQQGYNGTPIIVCNNKNLYKDLIDSTTEGRFSSIPAFTKNENGAIGMLRRQCTYDYKIRVIDDYIRDHIYGLPKGARRPTTSLWHGITLDEAERMAIPGEAWKINIYPFLDYLIAKNGATRRLGWINPLSRQQVINWYTENALPVPPKSSCVFCPYQSDVSWAAKKQIAPDDFQAAIRVDEAIRNSSKKGIIQPLYLHRSCKPLKDVVFDPTDNEQLGECSGHCHV